MVAWAPHQCLDSLGVPARQKRNCWEYKSVGWITFSMKILLYREYSTRGRVASAELLFFLREVRRFVLLLTVKTEISLTLTSCCHMSTTVYRFYKQAQHFENKLFIHSLVKHGFAYWESSLFTKSAVASASVYVLRKPCNATRAYLICSVDLLNIDRVC